MRLHIKDLEPRIVGYIYEDKAKHNHKNLRETLVCIIEKAMGITKTETETTKSFNDISKSDNDGKKLSLSE